MSRNLARRLDPFESFRVVQRGQLRQPLDCFDHLGINPDRGGEMPAAMNYAVRHCIRWPRQLGEESAQNLLRHELFAIEMLV